MYLYDVVYPVVICLKLYILPMIIFPFLPLCSKPSGFLHLLPCACIRPLSKQHSMHDRYVRLPHTANDNSHLLPLSSIASGFLHSMSCVCIRPLPEPHSIPDRYMRITHTTNDKFAAFTFMQYTRWFSPLLVVCLYQPLARTAQYT